MFIIFIILILLVSIFYILYGGRDGFNHLETFWIIYTMIFLIIIIRVRGISRKIGCIVAVLYTKKLYTSIFTILIIPVIFVCGYPAYKIFSNHLFTRCLDLKWSGYKLPEKPTIFLANYPGNYIEYFIHPLLGNKVCILMSKTGAKICRNLYGINNLIVIEKGKFQQVQKTIETRLNDGYHIFAYIDRDYAKRKSFYKVYDIRSGMFIIAKNIRATITPLVVDHIDHIYGVIESPIYRIHVVKTRQVTDSEYEISNVKILYEKTLQKFNFS